MEDEGEIEVNIFDQKGIRDPAVTRVVNSEAAETLEYSEELEHRVKNGEFKKHGDLQTAWKKAYPETQSLASLQQFSLLLQPLHNC